ncbi:MAG: PKD domain-containing protein [Vicinamibacterales bacterium]
MIAGTRTIVIGETDRLRQKAEAVAFLAVLLLAGPACSVNETAAPPFSGPSELATRVSLQAIPDSILQDGFSQATIQIEATGVDNRPVRALPLRVDIVFDGTVQDFGTVSAKSVVTDNDGRARLVYTAPPRPSEPVELFNVVTISVTPIGSDFRSATARTVDLRLIAPGVVLPPNSPPQARFTFTPTVPQALTSVVFDASTTTDEGVQCGALCASAWDFGDGSTGVGVFATHQFRAPGTFQVRLTATDARGASGSVAQPITVEQGVAPTASFTFSPANPAAGQTVFFTGEASRAAAGRQIVSYHWNFGSGRTGSGVTNSTSYGTPGTYTVTLTVTDDAGQQGTVSQTVPIRP